MSITKREHSLPLPKIFLTYCTNRDKEVIGGIISGRDLFVEEESAFTDEHKGSSKIQIPENLVKTNGARQASYASLVRRPSPKRGKNAGVENI